MAQVTTFNATNRSMLNRSLRTVEEMKGMVQDCIAQDEALLQQETILRNQLKDISLQRKQLKETIEETQVTLSRMESTVHRLKHLLSPMTRMPSEILLRIFHECVLLEKDSLWTMIESWVSLETVSVPITLGGVCSHWRTIVKQNARLWDNILIRQPYRLAINRSELQAQKEIISHWMAQGLQSRQSVLIDNPRPELQQGVYSILGSQSPSWNSIIIVLPTPTIFNGRWDVAKLRAGEVTVYRDANYAIDFFIPLLQSASKVTVAGPLPSLGNTPWVILRSLTICPLAGDQPHELLSFGTSELKNLLNTATYLEILKLNFTMVRDPTGSQDMSIQKTVNHRTLKSLSFHIRHLDSDCRLFGLKIEAPSLQQLNILSFDESRISYDPALRSPWEEVISVTLCKIQEHEAFSIVDFIRYLPNIATFKVQGQVTTLFALVNSFYDTLPPQYTSLPLSRLTSVTMTRTNICGATLLELVGSRLSHIQSKTLGIEAIKEVKLYDSDSVTVEEWKQVNILLEKGRASQ